MNPSSSGRRSLYLRKKKDRDLIKYIEPLLEKYDFSDIVRDLMRDGIKYRSQREHTNVLQSMQTTHTPNFEDVKLTKKEVSEEELKARMDGFFG